MNCGEVPPRIVEEEQEKLPTGYWVTFCTCQYKVFEERPRRPSRKCESGFKKGEVCGYDDVFWCYTGEHWGERCL